MSEKTNTYSFFKNIVSNIEQKDKESKKDIEEDIYGLIQKAHNEWKMAKNIFNNASEPDLIDFAIYNMEAAEKKYVYLMKKAKELKNNGNQIK